MFSYEVNLLPLLMLSCSTDIRENASNAETIT